MQSRDKLAKIKVDNYCLVSANKASVTIYVVRLIKDFRLKIRERGHINLIDGLAFFLQFLIAFEDRHKFFFIIY